ncbi:MAG: SDR family oxidoreductase [Pedobacter sp.]
MTHNDTKPILVAGATGYIGGRLVPRLLKSGYRIRAICRTPAKLLSRPWATHPDLEVWPADLLDQKMLMQAATGCRAAYYLVHSMGPMVADFAATDRKAAANFAAAAAAADLEKIIYLGGLGDEEQGLSPHLRSRAEVARVLRLGRVPVTVLRAAVIIGSGSASFEILRYLVERLPVMVTPRWVQTPCQPIAIRNVLHYLIGCLENQATRGETFDIGQEEVVTYRRLMEIYAEKAGLRKRWIIPVPLLTPRLSSYWISLVTPVPSELARPLTEGLRNPVVCHDFRIREMLPQRLLNSREAIALALERTQHFQVETSWSDAGLVPLAEWRMAGDPQWAGGTEYRDCWRIVLEACADETWQAVASIGGATGWYHANWLWRLRGFLDRLVGGIGLQRGRRGPVELYPGDALDFWRVCQVERPHYLQLAAEMKLPGQALLEFHIREYTPKQTELLLTARFLPRGLLGPLYWRAVMPLHRYVFNGMLRGIARRLQKKTLRGPKRIRPASGS